jgi:peroxiredoxin
VSLPVRRQTIWILVGFLAAAGLGIFAGTRFISWQNDRTMDRRVAGLARGESTKLRAGQPLPDVKLIAADGGITGIASAVGPGSAVVVIISLECAPCVDALLEWQSRTTEDPADPLVIVVCDDPVDRVGTWARETGFSLPLYSDAGHTLSQLYDVSVYPTVIGVDPNGQMVAIRHGFGPDFTPDDALKPSAP